MQILHAHPRLVAPAVLNRNDPLVRMMVYGAALYEGAGEQVQNLVDRRRSTTWDETEGTITWQTDPQVGRCLLFEVGGASVDGKYIDSGQKFTYERGLSVAALIYPEDTGASCYVCSQHDDTAGDYGYFVGTDYNAGSPYYIFGARTTDWEAMHADAGDALHQTWQVVVWTLDLGGNYKHFRDGVLVKSGTRTNPGAVNVTANQQNFIIGMSGYNLAKSQMVDAWQGGLAALYIFNGVLPECEVVRIARAPRTWWMKRRPTLGKSVVAAGGFFARRYYDQHLGGAA